MSAQAGSAAAEASRPVTAGSVRASGSQPRLPYSPALDGLRAIAVLAVLLYHGQVQHADGGFLGVDIFFALSGYLITSLLLVEWRTWGAIDLVGFWMRRARRLLPALMLVLIGVSGYAVFFADAAKQAVIKADSLGTLFYVANWRFIVSKQSYFEQYGDPSPLRHMWSLGIEEQFYFVFPLLLLGLLALTRGRRRITTVALSLGAVASALLTAALFVPGHDPSFVYYSTATRAQTLLVGAAFAAWIHLGRPWNPVGFQQRILGVAGIVAAAAVAVVLVTVPDDSSWPYRGGFLLFALATVTVIAAVTLQPESRLSRVIGIRPLVLIGLISYGLYLWHWPVYVLLSPARTGLEGAVLLGVRLALTFVIATASYVLVERPIRRGALRRWPVAARRTLVVVSVPAIAVLVVAATSTAARPPPPPLHPAALTSLVQGDGTGARVLVVGDSAAFSLAAGFEHSAHPGTTVASVTKLGCGLGPKHLVINGSSESSDPRCDDWRTRWSAAVTAARPTVSVLMVGPWEVFDQKVDGQVLSVGSDTWADYLTRQLDQARQVLAPDGQTFVILNAPCYNDQETAAFGANLAPTRNDPKRAAAVNTVIDEYAAAAADKGSVVVADLDGLLCPDGTYQDQVAGVQARPDGVHFSTAGAAVVWDWLVPQLPRPTTAQQGTSVFLVGDSVPYRLREYFAPSDVAGLTVGGSTQLGCGLLPYDIVVDGRSKPPDDPCLSWSLSWPGAVTAQRPDIGVVFAGVGELFDRNVNGRLVRFGTPEYARFLQEALDANLAPFRHVGSAIALPTVPCHAVVESGVVGGADIINDDDRITWLNGVLADYARLHSDVTLIDLYDYLCRDGYTNEVGGVTLRSDGLHFTPEGTSYVWRWLGPLLLELDTKQGGP